MAMMTLRFAFKRNFAELLLAFSMRLLPLKHILKQGVQVSLLDDSTSNASLLLCQLI